MKKLLFSLAALTIVCLGTAQQLTAKTHEPSSSYTWSVQSISNQDVEIMELETISVRPNPTNANLFVDLSGLTGNVSYTVASLTGPIVREARKTNDDQLQIDLSNESAGVYFLILQNDNNSRAIKVVKE